MWGLPSAFTSPMVEAANYDGCAGLLCTPFTQKGNIRVAACSCQTSSTPEIMKARPKGFFAAAKNRAATSHQNLIRRLSIWQGRR